MLSLFISGLLLAGPVLGIPGDLRRIPQKGVDPHQTSIGFTSLYSFTAADCLTAEQCETKIWREYWPNKLTDRNRPLTPAERAKTSFYVDIASGDAQVLPLLNGRHRYATFQFYDKRTTIAPYYNSADEMGSLRVSSKRFLLDCGVNGQAVLREKMDTVIAENGEISTLDVACVDHSKDYVAKTVDPKVPYEYCIDKVADADNLLVWRTDEYGNQDMSTPFEITVSEYFEGRNTPDGEYEYQHTSEALTVQVDAARGRRFIICCAPDTRGPGHKTVLHVANMEYVYRGQ